MKQSANERHTKACECTHRADERRTAVATRPPRPRATTKAPRTLPYFNFGMIFFIVVFLLILSDIQPAESRRISRKKNRNVTDDASEGGRGSRQRGKPRKILNTVEKARIITQKKYLKSDWCKSRPLKQIVRAGNGCKGVFINHFCYGQCNSFYIPRDLTPDMTEPEYFKSCAFCKPHREERISVTLTCSRNRGRRNRVIKRMVNKIRECRCIAVPDVESRSNPQSSPASAAASSATSAGSAMTASDSSESKR